MFDKVRSLLFLIIFITVRYIYTLLEKNESLLYTMDFLLFSTRPLHLNSKQNANQSASHIYYLNCRIILL